MQSFLHFRCSRQALLTGLLLSVPLVPSADTVSQDHQALVEQGREIYFYGIGIDGAALEATVQGDVPFRGSNIACVNCHRRSGLGSSEAANLVPPITGQVLYNPVIVGRYQKHGVRTEGDLTRPAYTGKTLARALREGIDAQGNLLSGLMPRYDLSDLDLAAIREYLVQLGANTEIGMDSQVVHMATIITDDVSDRKRDTVLAVLKTFFKDRNANTRNETGRAKKSPWNMDWRYKAYRKWRLHVWHLHGAPATWYEQLQSLYQQQPVFAVIGGIGRGDWSGVHDFCEARQVPCLFPITSLPVDRESDFYSVYFDRGVALEADTVTAFLKEQGIASAVLQVHTRDAIAAVAAEAFARAQDSAGLSSPETLEIGADAAHQDELLARIANSDLPDTLVLWGGKELTPVLEAVQKRKQLPSRIVLSESLSSSVVDTLQQSLLERVLYLRCSVAEGETSRGIMRSRLWARAKGLNDLDERILARTQFAVGMAQGAFQGLVNNFSREYFIEQIEHMVDNSLSTADFSRVSLAPSQRFISRGCHVIKPVRGPDGEEPFVRWIIP